MEEKEKSAALFISDPRSMILFRLTPLRKGMGNPIMTDDAIRVLRRYQRWRKSDSDKTFDQSGLDVKEIGEALDHVLMTLPVVVRALASARGQLAKCQVQRERFHAALRRETRGKSQESRERED